MNAMNEIENQPHNIELEQVLLGALLTNNDNYYKINGILQSNHFMEATHADIFNNIERRITRDHIASPTTMKADLEAHEGLKELGGPRYLARLAGAAISSFHCVDYAKEIVELWKRREMLVHLEDVTNSIRSGGDSSAAKAGLEMFLAEMPDEDGKESSVSLLSAMTDAINLMNEAYKSDVSAVTIQTGIQAIDERLGGLWPADLIILAGRPSMGKTSLALSIASRVASAAKKEGKVVALISAEMTEVSVAQRLLSEASSIPYSQARKGDVTENEFRKVVEAAKSIESMGIDIVPPHIRDVAAIYSTLKRIRAKRGRLDLVIVDYLQLLRAPGNGRTEQMTNVSIALKSMAKMLNVPVIALSQLSRQVEQRDNKRPVLSDLRESGQIEQDADVVLFCYRDHYYLSRQEPPTNAAERADYEAVLERSKNVMEVITGKQRMGSIGIDKIGCHVATNRFWDLEEQKQIEGF